MSQNIYRLLVEEPTYEVSYVIEEKNRNSPSKLKIKGPMLLAAEANKNKRIYPMDLMAEEVNRYTKEMIANQRSTGELNHPQSPEINLERVCHLVTELTQKGNVWEGESTVLSTPMGNIVRALVLDGVRLGVSSRALGRPVPQDNGIDRVEDFRLVAIDVVADPSVPSAFVNGILESKQWTLSDNGAFSPVFETFEKNISKLPTKGKDQYLKEQILSFINALKTL